MLHSLYVFISLSNALVSTTPEAAPAAKSEGCQPNHFGLGLGLGYGLGRICSFLWCTIYFHISSLSPSPMVSGRSGSSRHVRKPMVGFEKSSD